MTVIELRDRLNLLIVQDHLGNAEVIVPTEDYPCKLTNVRIAQGTYDSMGGAFLEGRGHTRFVRLQ